VEAVVDSLANRFRGVDVPSLSEQHGATSYGSAPAGLPADAELDEAFGYDSCPVYSPDEESEMELEHQRAQLRRASANVAEMSDPTLLDCIELADELGCGDVLNAAAREVCRRLELLAGGRAA
jgi:hypothetical protein